MVSGIQAYLIAPDGITSLTVMTEPSIRVCPNCTIVHQWVAWKPADHAHCIRVATEGHSRKRDDYRMFSCNLVTDMCMREAQLSNRCIHILQCRCYFRKSLVFAVGGRTGSSHFVTLPSGG